ncbi:M20 aminoacylase family protein [Mesorhizobium sp. Z1-4]|uniref:M20 aminoacylase family protein n=1 Tax=Mesorhizobium sp. Z1-4 TaxID=2448478 RepID=UPI000FDA3337|nr:M20 aminoacylase family protein [Mesorhizobium sp. Z1-4]
MPVLNRAAELHDEVAGWRRHIHAHPELGFDLPGTANFVAERLREFGCDQVETGIGQSGIVAVIKGNRGDGPTIGLRADMDALPIVETSGAGHASGTLGIMHACGHDGHTAMLLGAAKYLAETRNFSGTCVLIFQPAEEIGQGAKAMIDDGVLDRFGIDRVFGMHNMPGLKAGSFAIKPAGIMGSVSRFTLRVIGVGGHAARPNATVDPIVIASQIITALQTIVGRNTDPVSSVVVSVTSMAAGTAFNIIPEQAEMLGTVRTLEAAQVEETRAAIERIAQGIAAAHGATVEFEFDNPATVTFNHGAETDLAANVAADIAGEAGTDRDAKPVLAGEDFSHMLNARPGAFIFIGNGESAGLHHPAYDFNDAIIPQGISYWVRLTETALKPAT